MISIVSSSRASTAKSRAISYGSRNLPWLLTQPKTVASSGMPASAQIVRRLSPSTIRSQIVSPISSVYSVGRPLPAIWLCEVIVLTRQTEPVVFHRLCSQSSVVFHPLASESAASQGAGHTLGSSLARSGPRFHGLRSSEDGQDRNR